MVKPNKELKNWYYHRDLINYYAFNLTPQCSILNIHHGNDIFRDSLKYKNYKSVNISKKSIFPDKKFDFIFISDSLSVVRDIQSLFHKLKKCSSPNTRLIVNYHNYFWLPFLKIAVKLGIKDPQKYTNWLNTDDVINLLSIENYQIIKVGQRLLIPVYIPVISYFINRYIAYFPVINKLCFTNYLISRPVNDNKIYDQTVSVIIPVRNESGNIENTIKRLPKLGKHTEIIFIEGYSSDNTWDKIIRVQNKYKKLDIKVFKQQGIGKADAVRLGFIKARGNILMILDADLTVPPEELTKFYEAINKDKGEFINGCRLVYPVQKEAMQFLNTVANHLFSTILSWILNIKIKDTLCGTKVISKKNYLHIARNRKYFGDFDPFGDFDLIFGAAKLNTNISRFKHGWLLLKMTIFALFKLKFV